MDKATQAIMEEAAEKKRSKAEEGAYSKSMSSTEYSPKSMDSGMMRKEDSAVKNIDKGMMTGSGGKTGVDAGELGKKWDDMFKK